MTRFLSILGALAFAGALMVGCEGDKPSGTDKPPTPPTNTKEAAPKTPAAPTTPPAKTDEKKTGDAVKDAAGSALAGVVNSAAKDVANMTKCGLEGCSATVNPLTAKASCEKDGKKFYFCCDDCKNKFLAAK